MLFRLRRSKREQASGWIDVALERGKHLSGPSLISSAAPSPAAPSAGQAPVMPDTSSNSLTLSVTITAAIVQAAIFSQTGLANSPILARSLVK